MNRQQYREKMIERARLAFETHRVDDYQRGRWTIDREDGDRVHRATLVPAGWGRLLVHGDVEPVLFQTTCSDPIDILHYLAERDIVYAAGKVIRPEPYWDREVAVEQIGRLELSPSNHRRALDFVSDGAWVELTKFLWTLDVEDGGEIGRLIHPRVFYAHEAIKTLCRLRSEKEEKRHANR